MAALTLVLCLLAPEPALAQAAPDLTVRIYDRMRLPAETLVTARAVVEGIFTDADLLLLWQECDTKAMRCHQPPTAGEMVVRLMKAPPPFREAANRLTLGESILAPPTEASIFATVYPDRVRHLADRAAVSVGVPLGYAIAHELAHLLLRSHAHTSRGLLREHWTAEEVHKGQREDWLLPADERVLVAAAARERVTLRTARAVP